MKLSGLKRFTAFLDVLFDFFEEYGITSCLRPMGDPAGTKELLLGSRVSGKSYIRNTGQFIISLDLSGAPCGDDIYYFLFWPGSDAGENQFLVDLRGRTGFIMVEINDEKYPPFTADFLDGSGELRTRCRGKEDWHAPVAENEIMTMDELKDFLRVNSARGDINWIGVE